MALVCDSCNFVNADPSGIECENGCELCVDCADNLCDGLCPTCQEEEFGDDEDEEDV